MPILVDIAELATCAEGLALGDAGIVRSAALVWEGQKIIWVGLEAELPQEYRDQERVSAHQSMVVPGLVDCHTHLCFGGWRADEFEQRCRGVGYLEIARSGGGIMRTVAQTRATDGNKLLALAADRLDAMARLGVTTVECKSGYGLSLDDELKILEVYRKLASRHSTRIVSTFLGAHVVPTEYRSERQRYVDIVCLEMLPRIAAGELAEFCDVFVEEGAFTTAEARRILACASDLGLRPKLHVDQLADGAGAALAAEVGAISADHLEYSNDDGMRRMVDAGVVPVTLPVASLYLRQRPLNGRRWIEAGAEVAVATDFNPGTAPSYHLPFAMTLACTMNGLTPTEALLGATRIAARAIGRSETVGSIVAGKMADFALVDAPSINHWLYHFQPNQVVATYIGGNLVASG
jgi:imidazolonepropionase